MALAIARVLSGEAKEFAEQYRIVRPDGSTCWLDAHGVMLQDEGLHMMGVGVDITGLKTIQRSLEESEEKYLLLLNSTAEAIYGLDLNGLCTFCNPACLRLLGYEKPADLLGKNMHQLMHHTRPDGTPYPAEECVIYRAIREGVPSHLSEEVLWRADGSRLFVEYWSHPMFRNGEPVGAVVTFLDLTERRRAEEARRASEAQYRELFENATYGIVVASEDGTLLDANPAVIRMLGYGSKEELLERNLQRDIEMRGTSGIGARECEWMRKDGKTITVHLSSRAIRGPDGAVTQTQVIAEDVTERKQAEAELRSLTGRILSVEDEERRRLARGLHDTTSQSLVALCMNLSVVSESAGVLNPRAQAAIAESAALADQCLREIRTVSYLLHPAELDELGLQYALSHYIGGFIQRSGIQVEIEVPPDLGRLPRLIETTVFRIVQECLTNIHRHSRSDTARVRIVKHSSNLVLEVEDAGDGIRADAPSGIGIVSMRERLQQVNGRLETISEPGGTVIRATIPLRPGI